MQAFILELQKAENRQSRCKRPCRPDITVRDLKGGKSASEPREPCPFAAHSPLYAGTAGTAARTARGAATLASFPVIAVDVK